MRLQWVELAILLVLVVVPVVCVVVAFLPVEVRVSLMSRGDVLDFGRFVSATFVHADFAHLSSNLAGFVAVGVVLFLLARQCGCQRFLLVSLLWVVLVVPLVYGVVVWLFADLVFRGVLSGFGGGLSLVVGGLAGLVLPLLVLLFYNELEGGLGRWRLFLGLFMLTGSLVVANYLYENVFYWVVFAGLCCGAVGLLALSFYKVIGYAEQKLSRERLVKVAWAVFGLLFYIFCLAALFPREIVLVGLGRVNVFAHYFGVVLGALTGFYLFVGDKK